jgi:hypothetical protein
VGEVQRYGNKMVTHADTEQIAGTMPGEWTTAASSFPAWTYNPTTPIRLSYRLEQQDPLVLSHVISFETGEGKPRTLTGRDRWAGTHFRTRIRRFDPRGASRWAVRGVHSSGDVLVLAVSKVYGTPDGLLVLVRDAAVIDDLRALVAESYDQFGFSPEEFASLSWL